MTILSRKPVEMVEFDLGQIIYDEITKHAEKLYVRHLLPYPSLIFQILYKKNSCLGRSIEHYEREVTELNFSPKWLEGKQSSTEPIDQQPAEEVDEEHDAPGEVVTELVTNETFIVSNRLVSLRG